MELATLKDAVPLLGAVVTALVALIGVIRGPGRLRSKLKTDAEIAAVMPDSPARTRMLKFVEDEVAQLIEDETEERRDWGMLVFAVLSSIILAAATLWLAQRGTWWGYLAATPLGVLWLIFLYGIFETGQKVKRDERGVRIERG